MRPSRSKKIIILILVLLLCGGAAFGGYYYYQLHQGNREADAVLDAMYNVVPNLGQENDGATGNGRDPLAAMSINGIDIVGCLEIPSLNIMAPVRGKGSEGPGFATWHSGSPVKGNLRISAAQEDLFRSIGKLRPGDKVFFTDIDGIRYSYQVTTQYHLKNWDEGDNELMLSYETDSDTHFVVGCSQAYGD